MAEKGEPPVGKEGETPEQKATREAAEAEARKPKFESVEEYDKAYKEAETKMHTATQETARERVAREKVEAELAETKRLLEEAKKPPEKEKEPPAIVEDVDAQLEAVAQSANEEAVAALAALPDVDQYDAEAINERNKTVAGIWAKAHAKIVRAAQKAQKPPSAEELDTLIEQKYQAKEAERVKAAAKAETDAANARAWESALGTAEKAGLSVRDKKSADSIVFNAVYEDIPEEFYGKPDEATQWMITETRSRLGKVVEQTDEQRKRAAEHQKNNSVMGKGINFTPSKQPAQRSYTSMRKERETEGGLI